MKKTLLILASLFAVTAFAQDKGKGEPFHVKSTPNPVVAPEPDVKKEPKPSKSKKPAVKNQTAPAKTADATAK
jgi:hypothetical protein